MWKDGNGIEDMGKKNAGQGMHQKILLLIITLKLYMTISIVFSGRYTCVINSLRIGNH